MSTSSTLSPPVPRNRLQGSNGKGPWDGSRDGEGGGGGGGGDSGQPPISNAYFAVILLIIASTMLFAALVGGFIVLRKNTAQWPPEGTPPLPALLDVSTLVIVASSLVLLIGHMAVVRSHAKWFRGCLALALLLGASFLGLQCAAWMQWTAAGVVPGTNNFAGKFYLLSWAHALHALAGVGALALVTVRAFAGRYHARRHLGVDLACMFWHFVDLVWVALFFLLRM